MAPGFLLCIPFFGLMIPDWNLAAFIVFFALAGMLYAGD